MSAWSRGGATGWILLILSLGWQSPELSALLVLPNPAVSHVLPSRLLSVCQGTPPTTCPKAASFFSPPIVFDVRHTDDWWNHQCQGGQGLSSTGLKAGRNFEGLRERGNESDPIAKKSSDSQYWGFNSPYTAQSVPLFDESSRSSGESSELSGDDRPLSTNLLFEAPSVIPEQVMELGESGFSVDSVDVPGLAQFSNELFAALVFDAEDERNMVEGLLRQLEQPWGLESQQLSPSYLRTLLGLHSQRWQEFVGSLSSMLLDAGFLPLSERDLAISSCLVSQGVLRTDVSVDESRLMNLSFYLDSQDGNMAIDGLGRVLVWKRGIGIEQQQGSLLLQKLDYLQGELFEAVSRAFLRNGKRLWRITKDGRAMVNDAVASLSELAWIGQAVGTGSQKGKEGIIVIGRRLLTRWGFLSAYTEHAPSEFMDGGEWQPLGTPLPVQTASIGEAFSTAFAAAQRAITMSADSRFGDSDGKLGLWDTTRAFISALVRPVSLRDPVWEDSVVLYAYSYNDKLLTQQTAKKKTFALPVNPGKLWWKSWIAFVRSIDPSLPAAVFDRKFLEEVLDEATWGCMAEEIERDDISNIRENAIQIRNVENMEDQPGVARLIAFDGVKVKNVRTLWPDRKLQFKPLDSLRLDLVTVFTLLAVLAQIKLDNAYTQIVGVVTTSAWVFGAVFRFNARRNEYELETSRLLAQKTTARGLNVVRMASEGALEQRTRRALLTYYTLLSRGPAAMPDLVHNCGCVLRDIDPDCEDVDLSRPTIAAVHDLLRFGVVELLEENRYRAIPLEQATEQLAELCQVKVNG